MGQIKYDHVEALVTGGKVRKSPNLTGNSEKLFSYNKQIAWRSGPRRWSVVAPVEKPKRWTEEHPNNPASVTTNRHIQAARGALSRLGFKVVEVPY